MQDPVAGTGPVTEPGGFARLFGVLVSPAKTFESIARRPGWVLPVGVFLLWAAFAGVLIAPRLDVDAIIKKQADAMEKQGSTLSDEQAEGMRKTTEFFVRKLSPVIGVVFWAILLFLAPAIYHGLSAMLGKTGKYTAVLSAYAHAQMVQLVKGVLLLVVILQKASVDPETIETLLKSNIGSFLDKASVGAPLHALLLGIDIFDLWGIALCIIALPRVTRLSKGASAAVVLGAWGAWLLCKMVLAVIGAAFGG